MEVLFNIVHWILLIVIFVCITPIGWASFVAGVVFLAKKPSDKKKGLIFLLIPIVGFVGGLILYIILATIRHIIIGIP